MNMMELDNLGEGYRFRPTDSELVKFLLSHGHSTGGVEDNWDTCIYRYFITPRKKNKGRFSRIVGRRGGTWIQQDKGRAVTIKSCDQRKRDLIIGRMKSMCYNNKCINSDDYNDGKWLMKEYVLSDPILNKFSNSERKDYVICAIKKLPKRSTTCNFSETSNVTTESTRGG
ncbi:NAC domain-containing protein 96-like [Nicotiana tabacum]|uniref:NAC domain-containing protein 96-like n=1 Tax=Nicotiana tabacum TaxID=4097 RepID=A0AC58U6N0_TOBAC